MRLPMRLNGSIPAMLTPFHPDGSVDEAGFRAHAEWLIAGGSNGLVPVGTTGESPTLSHREHERLIDICVETAGGRVPVIAGTGSNATEEAVSLTRYARQAGADAALVITPYYNKPNQEGLFLHFKTLAEAVELPIVIYNVPARTAVDIATETVARLTRAYPHIIGIKDASADLARPLALRAACGPEFRQVSGEDATALAHLANGGVGCISVTANIAPRQCAAMHTAWQAGDTAQAQAINDQLYPLHHALFLEPSPAPLKCAAALLGRAGPTVRAPLAPVSDSTRAALRAAMAHAGLPDSQEPDRPEPDRPEPDRPEPESGHGSGSGAQPGGSAGGGDGVRHDRNR